MLQEKTINLLGYASGIAAGNSGCGDGPVALQKSLLSDALKKMHWHTHWDILYPIDAATKTAIVAELCTRLAKHTQKSVKQKQFFTMLGGDHSCAIGTWSGVAHALRTHGPVGLLWFDAHMDSHTFETSPSHNIHGMPVASLLGHGAKELTTILDGAPKLLPEHLCLIGIRSFESEEAELLQHLGVRIYYIEEVQQRGLTVVVQEALAKIKQGIVAFGVSIDVDSIDPSEAPAVGTPEPNGLASAELITALQLINTDPKYIGAEITEFNPHLDKNRVTEQLIQQLVLTLLPRRI